MLTSIVRKNLALAAAVSLVAALGTGCSSSKSQQPQGGAKVAFNVASNALNATTIAKATLTVGPGTGTPSFTPIVTDMTNQDLSGKLNWTAYVQGIPAGTGRTFHIDAFDNSTPAKVLYSGDAVSDIVAGQIANVFMVLQEKNPNGGFGNFLPMVDSLTSSASIVTNGTSVTLAVAAHSPNTPPDALTYSWTASCGSIASGTTTTPVWTAPAAPPPSPTACQINVTVTDQHQGSVTAYLAITYQAQTTGNAQVAAYPNSWPMIAGIIAHETFTKNTSGQVVAMDVDLTVTASDPDGDDVQYVWSSPDCAFPAAGFTSATVTTKAATITTGPGAIGSNAVHFNSTDVTHGCTLRVDVTDDWKNGIVPVGSGLPVARGGDTVGLINASKPTDFVLAPQITKVYQPNPSNQVQPGQTVILGIETLDPTPNFNTAQTPFTYAWTQTGGAFVAGSEVDVTSSPGKSVIQWTAPATFVPGEQAKVVVTNRSGLTATYTWNFTPANPCAVAGSNGTACDTGQGLCAPNGACLNGACASPTPVTCTALDQCHLAGICNPATGTCSNPTQPAGTACTDGNGCTTGDVCTAAGACAGTAVVCNTPADAQCQSTPGTCTATSATTFTCSYASAANGTACNADNNGCTQNDSCQAGVCTAGTAVACSQTTNPCQAATGTCSSTGASTFSCSFAPLAGGTSCNTAGTCVTGQTCNGSGLCSGGTPFCPAGQSCTPSTPPVCAAPTPVPYLAKDLQLGNFVGLATGTDGSSYVNGVLLLPAKTFDGITLTSAGAGDAALIKYGPTGTIQWAKNYGDAADQQPAGVAVTSDGTVASIGQFLGNITPTVSNTGVTPIDYLLSVDSATGNVKWAKSFNDGVSGALYAVAASPVQNLIAVCGHANQAATDLVPGATFGGGSDDIVIAVFDSTGALKWSKQIGGANEEECDSLAIDDSGTTLYAAGKYDGALTFTGTALPNPASSFRRWIWVASFNATTGAAIAQASFGSGAGNHKPQSIAIDASEKLIVSGYMTNTLSFAGSTALLTAAGGTDAFVAKLDPAAATPFAGVWSTRMGGTGPDEGRGAAVDSFGDVLWVGLFNGTTTGAAALTASNAGGSSAFVLKLAATTGVAQFSAAYGNATFTVNANKVAVDRWGTGAVLDSVVYGGEFIGSLNFGGTTSPLSTTTADDFLVFAKLQ